MLKTASLMSLLSQIVYEDYDTINSKLLKLGMKDWAWFERDGTQAMIVHNPSEIICCFRGTEPDQMTDVLADLKAWPKRSRERGLVHFGFAQALDKVYDEMVTYLERLSINAAEDCKVICTGHSLGAALATLFASRQDAHELYTFGSPRVGTRSFVKEIKNDGIKHYRFVNNNDIVTKVPFALMGYRHSGELVYINHYGNIRKMTAWQRVKDKFRGRLAAWRKREPFDGVRDHDIGAYHKNIKNVSI
jgi:triacylglycerol lipase